MPKKAPRTQIPKAISDLVLKEFNHRCAICGADHPQLHHIDHDPSNSCQENLLPLCPNHHLTDQHNPTRAIHPKRLELFRRFKDPSILTSQFEPLFRRMLFLVEWQNTPVAFDRYFQDCRELVAFLRVLQLGEYYAPTIEKLLAPQIAMAAMFGNQSRAELESFHQKQQQYIRFRVEQSKDEAISLCIECLRYQEWR